jgi:DNA polymerase III delta prime subunit
MDRLINSYKQSKNLHHAYFLVGDTEIIFSKLKDFLEKSVGIKTSGNPDFWQGKFATLTIDDARDIAEAQARKDFKGEKKIFVIRAGFITEEAQNSLLKVFEEPTTGTHFFIISPQDILLPTLRSRMQVILNNIETVKSLSILDLKFKERLEMVKEVTDAIKDEDKTKQDAITLLNQIEKELHVGGVEKFARSLRICEEARESLYDRGAPVKIILENVMLSI